MPKILKQLQDMLHFHGPAQVAVWMGYKDSRPIQQWVIRGKIPPARIAKLIQVINQHGVKDVRIVRRPKRQKETAI